MRVIDIPITDEAMRDDLRSINKEQELEDNLKWEQSNWKEPRIHFAHQYTWSRYFHIGRSRAGKVVRRGKAIFRELT